MGMVVVVVVVVIVFMIQPLIRFSLQHDKDMSIYSVDTFRTEGNETREILVPISLPNLGKLHQEKERTWGGICRGTH